ncbi:hypothetical protein QJS10_CPA09g00819 [Acorus calamus]|uniref:Reverse transcriptase domain-containing protein n=1 Tax=Acorus calamus TaxID=4465 RepID=A0AAV9E5D5_ACOCL|nr:hypothetical protein QJS10_CPA09g00819 [Acorus calamus]
MPSAKGRSCIKVDLRKAFDSVRWEFLEEVMRGMNFPPLWTHLVLQCVTTASYSVLALSSKLDAAVTHGTMGKFLKHDLNISHLCFADDLIIFTDAQASSAHSLKLLLEEFSMASGLHLNPLKSQLFSSCSAIEQSQILGIQVKKLVVNIMPSVGRKSALQRSREA